MYDVLVKTWLDLFARIRNTALGYARKIIETIENTLDNYFQK